MTRRNAMQRFGEKLRTLRQQRQMTLTELAQALGYTAHSYISAVENGKKQPTIEFVLKVSRLFAVRFLNQQVAAAVELRDSQIVLNCS